MNAIQQMIERINGRLAALERQTRERPDWLRGLMLAGPRSESESDPRAEERYSGTLTPR
jgi:hypothetical protein